MIHYEIKSGDRLIYSSFRVNQDFAATNIKFVDEVGKVPTLTFDLPPDNPVTLEVIKDEVQMYRNGEMIFNGNVKTRKRKFNKFVTYYCEGDLGYLHDIFVRPIKTGTTTEGSFIGYILGLYQSAVSNRQLSFENLAPGQEITYNIEDYTDCYDAIFDNLFSIYSGGFLRTRHEKDPVTGEWTHYVDFFASPPSDPNAQKIVYAKNILDINDDDDGRDIVTHYIPLGATVDKDRVKLSGNDYIAADSTTLTEYGVIERVHDYSDVEVSGTLRTYAEQDYAAMDLARKKRAVKVKAVDLAIVDDDETPLQVGYMYEVYSHPHEIEFTGGDKKQLLRAEIDPNNPDKCYFWFGDVPKDSMRRIQADRALAEETRQRVQKEASYTNAIGADSNSTYETKSGSPQQTGGADLTTTSGHISITPSWTQVPLLKTDNTAIAGGSLKVNGSPTVGGETKTFNGTLAVDDGSMLNLAAGINAKSRLWKATATVTPGKAVNGAYVATATGANGAIIGCSVSGISSGSVSVVMYAVSDDTPTGKVDVAVIAIGT